MMSADEIIEATLERGHIPTVDEISIVLSRLSNAERKWRDRTEMLEREGYLLRPRLRPGWTPSWIESGKHPLQCEDGHRLPVIDSLDHFFCCVDICAGSAPPGGRYGY